MSTALSQLGGRGGMFFRRSGRFPTTTEASVNKTWAQSRGKMDGGWLGDSESQVYVPWPPCSHTALPPLSTCDGPGGVVLSSG